MLNVKIDSPYRCKSYFLALQNVNNTVSIKYQLAIILINKQRVKNSAEMF